MVRPARTRPCGCGHGPSACAHAAGSRGRGERRRGSVAKVILEPLGDPRERFLPDDAWCEQRDHMEGLNRALRARRDEIRAGWGPKYVARVREKGKLPTWDRIERLKDAESPILPIGTLVNYGRTFGEDQRTSPGAGVVTAFVRTHGRWILVIANDNTAASGSWWPRTP